MIKNLISAALLLLIFSSGFSQTKKGNFVLSGKTDLSFLFSNTTTGRDSLQSGKLKNTQYSFTTGFGYFIANNLMMGLSGSYSYSDTKIERSSYQSGQEDITTTLAVIPVITYYFPVQGKLKPSLSIGAGYIGLKERASNVTANNNIVYSLNGPSYNGGAGFSYFITPSVSFDLGLQYTHNRLKDKLKLYQVQKQNIVAGSFGVSIFF